MDIWAENLVFPESLRWHNGRLWFSDMHDHWVKTVQANGCVENIVRLKHKPSGIGILDENIFISSMHDRKVYRFDQHSQLLHQHADLSQIEPIALNDMHITKTGNIYVGGFGFKLTESNSPKTTFLTKVSAENGNACIVAENLCFPNGITSKDKTLYVAETFTNKVSSFDITNNGFLANQKTLISDIPLPDGICIDKDNVLWVASVGDRCVYSFDLTHKVKSRIDSFAGYIPFSIEIAYLNKKALFIAQAKTYDPNEASAQKSGIICLCQFT